jgi:antagonist of KipI
MDAYAHRVANLLVGNPMDAAALEIGYTSASLVARQDCLIAATGAGFTLTVNERPMRMWTAVYVRENWRLQLEKTGFGNWATLAIHGGILTPLALGSRATYLRSILGTDPGLQLQPGDLIPIGVPSRPLLELASRTLSRMTDYSPNPIIHVIPGPQISHFTESAISTFYASIYTISPISDRSGYRLNGPALERCVTHELLSEGMARGCIQVPADGMPIVMQADCPTTGGYPKIASVIAVDQPCLAQVPIGTGKIHFVETTIEKAQMSYRKMMNLLEKNIIQPVPEDHSW